MGSSLEVMTPMVKGVDNGEHFVIINIVIAFGRGEGLREISAGMKIPITIPLHEYSSTSEERCVGHDDEWLLDVGEM